MPLSSPPGQFRRVWLSYTFYIIFTVDAAKDALGLLDYKCTLLAHVKLFIHENPQVLFCMAALNEFFSQSVLISGIAPTQVQYLDAGGR